VCGNGKNVGVGMRCDRGLYEFNRVSDGGDWMLAWLS
jgi:hypothetical protein